MLIILSSVYSLKWSHKSIQNYYFCIIQIVSLIYYEYNNDTFCFLLCTCLNNLFWIFYVSGFKRYALLKKSYIYFFSQTITSS